jgi:hypothetical protein
MYFFAIPLTIITYIKCKVINNAAYLPLLAIFRDPSELTASITPSLQIYGLLLRFDDLSLGVSDLLENFRKLIFSDSQFFLAYSLFFQLLLLVIVDNATERNHFHAEREGLRDRLAWWIVRVMAATRFVIRYAC